jgi:hypothetical protein
MLLYNRARVYPEEDATPVGLTNPVSWTFGFSEMSNR